MLAYPAPAPNRLCARGSVGIGIGTDGRGPVGIEGVEAGGSGGGAGGVGVGMGAGSEIDVEVEEISPSSWDGTLVFMGEGDC